MKYTLLITMLSVLALMGCAQSNSQEEVKKTDKKVGGRCEGCEAIYESPVPFEKLNSVDTLPDFFEDGPRLEISGIVYKNDGKTPAPGIIMYVYHTDQEGLYSRKGNETGWGKRHGYIRGWVKTDENGFYRFYTLRPASYPNSSNPQHIHPTIKEPGFTEYYIEDFLFSDDPYLEKYSNSQPRGGSGVLTVINENGILKAKRDIVLGLNVPGYGGN